MLLTVALLATASVLGCKAENPKRSDAQPGGSPATVAPEPSSAPTDPVAPEEPLAPDVVPDASSGSMDVYRDIAYVTRPGVPTSLTSLDLFASHDFRDAPVVVFVHGGSWIGGDKARGGQMGRIAEYYVDRGFIFASINYRLIGKGGAHPGNAHDVASAVRWLYGNASRYGGDGGRIYVIGHSAGAQLAGLVASGPRFLDDEPRAAIRGVVMLDCPAFDIVSAAKRTDWVGHTLRRAFPDAPSRRDGSPVRHVKNGRLLPPFLVAYATENGAPGAPEQSEDFHQRVLAASGRSELLAVADASHEGMVDDLGKAGYPLTEAVDELLAE